MNFWCVLAAIGLLALAGAGGVFLGWLEKKVMEEMEQREKEKYHA